MLSINMLGEVNITYKGERISDRLSTKTVAMLCLLLLNKNKSISKEKIASFFWPDSNEEAARYNVRYNLWLLGKELPKDAVGEQLILSGKDCCGVNPKYRFTCDRIILDNARPRENPTIDELIRLRGLFKGDFLEGMYLRKCNEFNELVLVERVACQNKQVEILDLLAALYEENNQLEDSLKIYQEMLGIEPYNEQIACRVINLMSRQGNRAAAICFYKKFELDLRNNLGISPDSGLQELSRRLSECSARHFRELDASGGGKRPKITVSPECIERIDFFFMSDLIRQLEENAAKRSIPPADPQTSIDLAYLFPDILKRTDDGAQGGAAHPGEVPPVRIVQSLHKYLSYFCGYADVDVVLNAEAHMDEISKEVLAYLESRSIPNLRFLRQGGKPAPK